MKDPADESLVPRHPGPEPDPYEDEEGGPVKPFLEHLEDLRWLLVRCLITFVMAFALCLCFAPQLMSILQAPLDKAAQGKITLAILEVTGSFTIALQIGIWGGLCIAFPFLLYFVGDYIVPALRKVEKKYLGVAFASGTILFALGGLMAYYWVAPISIKAFIGLGEWLKSPPAVWTAESYYGFVPKLVLGMGLAFELPIVILTLVKLNIISAEFLVNGRRYMIMANLILSAFITPQDIISTIMLAAPLQILFEICILIARHWDKQEKRKLRDLGFDV